MAQETDRIIRACHAGTKLGVGRSTVYAWVKQGVLPPPIKLGRRASGWRESTLDAFLAQRRAAG
jgi:prophage regulatory protein